jgi:Kef-type K+ transport system membrane component KefB
VRRLVVLLILYATMQGAFKLAGATAGSPTLMLLGFLVLAAYSVGEFVGPVGMPKIVGYLLAGLLFGPPGLGYVSPQALRELAPVGNLAIALIAFLAGAELQLDELRARWSGIARMTLLELLATFVLLTVTLVLLRGAVPALAQVPLAEAAVFAMLFAAVAVVHSPAATIALLSETRASGPVARYTLGVVLLTDVAVVLLFTAVLAVARALVPPAGGALVPSVGAVAWEIGGALLVGGALGGGVALYLRFIRRELFIFAILFTLLGAELARLAHVETLLTLLVAGFVAENGAGGGRGTEFRHAMERAAAPIFVVFFALAGARLDPGALLPLWPVVLPLVLVRMVAIRWGTRRGGAWAGVPAPVAGRVWLGLVSQAGVAIGLAAVVADVYPTRGAALQTLLLATIAVNQTLGPLLFRFALARAGELAPPEPSPREAAA